jgi:hypothetical protein
VLDRRLVVEQTLVVPLTYGCTWELSQPWLHATRAGKMCHPRLKDVVVENDASA